MTNIPADVHESLQSPISTALKRYILQECWNTTLTTAQFDQDCEKYGPYFHHYQTVCGGCSTDDTGRLTHDHLLYAFKAIKGRSFDDCKADLISFLAKSNNSHLTPRNPEEFVDRWIEQTGNALLLLDLSEWRGEYTLEEYLEQQQFMPSLQDDNFRIAVSLNLRNLQDIGGLTIRWTSLLSEHLLLEKGDTQLAVFHHASILDMLESSQIYPEGMTRELLLTFGMLVPRDDAKSRLWLQRQRLNPSRRAPGSSVVLDSTFESGRALKPGQRNVRGLNYFRDRMICIKDIYDNHEPQTLMQNLRDSRKPARRWAFCIAILVFLFGTVQMIEGAIQCYKAYYPSSS